MGFLAQFAVADELTKPPICSAATAGQPALKGICTVTPLGKGRNEIKVNLTAKTGPIEVGGYKVTTENYNTNYLTPVIEAMPGDTVAARLENLLDPRPHDGMAHGDLDKNPTNLHYFHGGIVTPNNAWPKRAELGNGDNIYVYLKAGRDQHGHPRRFEFKVPIPGKGALDARVLEKSGYIAHPYGLNWYHSHLHGISSDQVMGGMSGLLSVGDAKANVKAACKKDPNDKNKCSNDVDKDTDKLKDRTEVRYALLRDIPLRGISALPEDASDATATWAPQDRDFRPGTECIVWGKDGSQLKDEKLRKGFCQRTDIEDSKESAWLFTLNGQRFPTITVEGDRNLLLRLGNLSSNVAYWLELNEYNETDGTLGKPLLMTILSLDGVVPQRPVTPADAKIPVDAFDVENLLLMPASRAEVYVRNDNDPHPTKSRFYVLRTKGLKAGTDQWPEIRLALIELKPNSGVSTVAVALNAPVAEGVPPVFTEFRKGLVEVKRPPDGCVRDLDPAHKEYRRVTFVGAPAHWAVRTEIIRPESDDNEENLKPVDSETIGPKPFEDYELQPGVIDWTNKLSKKNNRHVCIVTDHKGSHKQLWVLNNTTGALHNFHIHQMKFRLATKKELESHHIKPPEQSHTCEKEPCSEPDYKFYDDQTSSNPDLESKVEWHDTIPIPPGSRVFLIMSFDAKQQVGRFVFHCHILKHEDKGLMAPIEVWTAEAWRKGRTK